MKFYRPSLFFHLIWKKVLLEKMTHSAKKPPYSPKHYMVVHTHTGRPIHVPGISGLSLTKAHMENLRRGSERGHMRLSVPATGLAGKIVVKLPKM